MIAIDIDADSLPGGSTLDSYVRVFNASGRQLAANDDSSESLDSFLTFRPTVAGTYYVGISGYGNGSYTPTRAASGRAGSTGDYVVRFGIAAASGGTGVRTAGGRDTVVTAAASAFAMYGANWDAAVAAATPSRQRRAAGCGY
jgi:hypothetical protein